MAIVVRMPAVMAGATEASLQSWLVAVGDEVALGQPIAEIETEKAVVEYGAEDAGTGGEAIALRRFLRCDDERGGAVVYA